MYSVSAFCVLFGNIYKYTPDICVRTYYNIDIWIRILTAVFVRIGCATYRNRILDRIMYTQLKLNYSILVFKNNFLEWKHVHKAHELTWVESTCSSWKFVLQSWKYLL